MTCLFRSPKPLNGMNGYTEANGGRAKFMQSWEMMKTESDRSAKMYESVRDAEIQLERNSQAVLHSRYALASCRN